MPPEAAEDAPRAAELTGHWRRVWLRAPGVEDTATRVHWMQAPGGYVDVRLPAWRPEVPGGDLSALPPGALLALARAEGFAGTIDVADGVCTWARAINWHGRPEGVDAGRLSWLAADEILETGINADYAERWRRQPGGAPAARVFAHARAEAHVVWDARGFAFGIGARDAPARRPVLDALGRGETPQDGLAALFESHFGLGVWSEGQGVVTLATHPGLEGRSLLPRAAVDGEVLALPLPDFRGRFAERTFHARPDPSHSPR